MLSIIKKETCYMSDYNVHYDRYVFENGLVFDAVYYFVYKGMAGVKTSYSVKPYSEAEINQFVEFIKNNADMAVSAYFDKKEQLAKPIFLKEKEHLNINELKRMMENGAYDFDRFNKD